MTQRNVMRKVLPFVLALSPISHAIAESINANSLTSPVIASAKKDKLPSFSELKIGAEHVTYSEQLANVGGFGQLKQSVSAISPTIRQSSFSSLNAKWGVYIEGASSMGPTIEKESWSIGDFGDVQQNDFQVQINEVSLKLSYQYTPSLQFTAGSKISTFNFTRSHFDVVTPGAKNIDDALIASGSTDEDGLPFRFLLPGQSPAPADVPLEGLGNTLKSAVSISENQLSVLIMGGIKFDTFIENPDAPLSWFAEAEASTPLYNLVTTTQIETVSLTDHFNGWGISGKIGGRYHLSSKIAITAGLDTDYQTRNAIADTLDSGARIRVPNIVYTNTSLYVGILWAY